VGKEGKRRECREPNCIRDRHGTAENRSRRGAKRIGMLEGLSLTGDLKLPDWSSRLLHSGKQAARSSVSTATPLTPCSDALTSFRTGTVADAEIKCLSFSFLLFCLEFSKRLGRLTFLTTPESALTPFYEKLKITTNLTIILKISNIPKLSQLTILPPQIIYLY